MTVIDLQSHRRKVETLPDLNTKILEASIEAAIFQFRLTAMTLVATLQVLDMVSEFMASFKPDGPKPG